MVKEPMCHIDAQTQREILVDPDSVQTWVEHLKAQGLAGDPMRVVWLRIAGRLDEAEELGWQVLRRSGGPSNAEEAAGAALPLSAVTAAIRLAHVLQWKRQFELAHTLYERALETVEAVTPMCEDSAYADYLHPFAIQHQARCYFDEERYQEALDASQRAYDLRVAAGVPEDQVLSSSGLIEACRERLGLS